MLKNIFRAVVTVPLLTGLAVAAPVVGVGVNVNVPGSQVQVQVGTPAPLYVVRPPPAAMGEKNGKGRRVGHSKRAHKHGHGGDRNRKD